MVVIATKRLPNTKLHTLVLDHHDVKLTWFIDWPKKEVLFNVDDAFTDDTDWFSFGFSQRGQIEGSDVCFFVRNIYDESYNEAIDTYIGADRKIYRDLQQDCELLRIDDRSVAFKRKFDTCDPQDFNMHEGTMYILWSRGSEILNFPMDYETNTTTINAVHRHKREGHSHSPHRAGINDGLVMAQLLRADKLVIPERDLLEVDVTLKAVSIPVKETTYWCHIQKLDDFIQQKHHIVQFEPLITNEDIVHHMEVFHCETDVDVEIPLYNGDCEQLPAAAKLCNRVISLWAMGASAFTYPKEAGLPIGGENYNPFIRLEVHFNNPELKSGLIDHSGMRIKMVSKLRRHDAAIMELGLEYSDKMAIPPGVLAFPLSGYCIAECTQTALPKTGITVFGSQLHTHLRGVRILTRHLRDDIELPELNRDDYYSHHYQEIRYLRRQVKVYPGDALITTCYYDTRGYTNTTLGGFSISDEMCVNYIQYYPATQLEVCKSSVSEKTLEDYFFYMKRREHQHGVSVKGARSENYRSIEWTKSHIDELYGMYVQEPLSMQCNQSNGHRFPGFDWEGAPISQAGIQVPMRHFETCENFNPYGVIPLEQGDCGYLGECIY